MSIHYKSCGLNNVWLVSGYETHETRYGTAVSYKDIDGLYRAITIHLCISGHVITPEAMRFLRKRLNLSQAEFGNKIGYTSQAVAKWEKGTSNIPFAVAKLVRVLCLKEFAPSMSLREAIPKEVGTTEGRLEFEYALTGWKMVGSHQVGQQTASVRVDWVPLTVDFMVSHGLSDAQVESSKLRNLFVLDEDSGNPYSFSMNKESNYYEHTSEETRH